MMSARRAAQPARLEARPTRRAIARSVLDRGIRDSGGARVDVLTSLSYGNALSQIAAALKHQHRVVYARPQQLIPPEKHRGRRRQDRHLRSPAAPARGQKER